MNRDDIIRMAREAGVSNANDVWLAHLDELERFADLVAAEWQEKCNTYIELHDAVVKDNDRLYVAVAKMREVLEVQGRDGNWNFDRYMQGMFNGMEMMMSLAEGRDPVFRDPPEKWLHAPPQREFIGLTDEEIRYAPRGGTFFDFARAIEAKLKEKNSG